MDPETEAPSAEKPKKKATKRKHAKKRPTKSKAKKTTRPKRKAAKQKKAGADVRSERLDMRLTKAEKIRINAKAKKTRRTVTSLVIEAIEKIR